MLLDCGEGAYAGLVLNIGVEKANALLRDLVAVWISHQHADHCLGLVEILGWNGRRASKTTAGKLAHPFLHSRW